MDKAERDRILASIRSVPEELRRYLAEERFYDNMRKLLKDKGWENKKVEDFLNE